MAQSTQTFPQHLTARGVTRRVPQFCSALLLISAAQLFLNQASAQEYQPPTANSAAANSSSYTSQQQPYITTTAPTYKSRSAAVPAPAAPTYSAPTPAATTYTAPPAVNSLPTTYSATTASTAPPAELTYKVPPAPNNTAPNMVPDAAPTVQAVRQFFQPPPETEYHLYDGDEVKIDVAGHPELSGTQSIGPDGRVTLPLAGSIVIAGLKRDEASTTLAHALAQYYHSPYVTVGVARYSSYRLIVLGNVQHPGEMLFDRPPTLLEALARAGVGSVATGGNLIGPEAANANNGASISGVAGLQAWRALIYRGDSSMAWVDIRGLLSGEAFGDLRLQRDDVVLIPTDYKFISVLGAVTHPGPQHLMPQVTLQEVIAVAGGLSPNAGNNPLITIVDPATRQSRTVRFLDLITPQGVHALQLRPGDVIYVPNSKMSQIGYALQQLNPIANVLTFSALAAEYF